MTSLEKFLELYGVWIGLGVYILVKDVVPFLFQKFIPERIKSVESQRKDRVGELAQERVWQHQVEQDRQTVLAALAKSMQDLALSNVQTNANIVTIMANQSRILSKQDSHHDIMIDAITDMKEKTAKRTKREA